MNFIIIIIIIYYKNTAEVRRKQDIDMNIYVNFHKLAASFIYVCFFPFRANNLAVVSGFGYSLNNMLN